MALSQDIKSQFAKAMTPKKESSETTVNGTFKIINGKEYVQLDGSDILTPVKSTVVADTGDRVKVLLKEHSAVVNGNITCPSARSKDLDNMKDEFDEFGNTVKMMDTSIKIAESSIIQLETNINQHEVTINQHETTIQQQGDNIVSIQNDILLQNNQISVMQSDINLQGSKIDSMDDTITSHGNSITEMNNTIIEVNNKVQSYDNTIEQMGNTIVEFNNEITTMNSNLETMNSTVTTHDSSINILNSAFDIVDGQLTGLSKIIVDALTTAVLNTGYAKIDFANIEMAAVTKIFSDSGIIKDLVTESGTITGELVGVTIKGDLIEANTLVADRLVIKGEDGLYYKLNMDSLGQAAVEADEKYQNGLNGSVIIAKSITADRIQVTDLVAFGATIGGFEIKEHSIHSHGKDSAVNPAMGLFLGDDGQLSFGDNEQYIRHYKDDQGEWHLEIKTNEFNIRFNNTITSLEDALHEINQNAIDQNKMIILEEEPPVEGNEDKIWYNPTDKSFYDVKEGQWVITNNFANEIGDLNERMNSVPNEINKAIRNFEEDTLKEQYALKTYVDGEIKSTEEGLSTTFNARLEPVESDTKDSKEQIQQWQGYINTGVYTEKPDGMSDEEWGTLQNQTYMLLGNTLSPYKVRIINNNLAILHNDIVTSHWENDLFVVERIEATAIKTDQLTVGNFAFVKNTDGSVSFRKVT